MARRNFSNKHEYLTYYLAQYIPNGAKLALCFDPEGMLDGEENVSDDNSRIFRILTYREDDLLFRVRFAKMQKDRWDADNPILLRITMPELCPKGHVINVTTIQDVLARVEGKSIDLRTDSVLSHLTEPVEWPEFTEMQLQRISDNLDSVVNAYWKLREKIGRKRPLAKYHISAVFLLSKYPKIEYSEIELKDAYPETVIQRYLKIAYKNKIAEEDQVLLKDVLLESSGLDNGSIMGITPWFEYSLNELALLIVLSKYLEITETPNPLVMLSGLGLLSEDPLPLKRKFPDIQKAIMEDEEILSHLIQITDQHLSQSQAEKLLEACANLGEVWFDTMAETTPATIAYCLLKNYLHTFLQNPETILALPEDIGHRIRGMDPWTLPAPDDPMNERFMVALRFVQTICTIQKQLENHPETISQVSDIPDIYPKDNEHLLELWLAFARKDAEVFDDEKLSDQIHEYIDQLEHQIVSRMEWIEKDIAKHIMVNVPAYLYHPSSSVHFIKDHLPDANESEKVWILLFDGMRLDSWQKVVRPILEEHFAIREEKILLAPLPTYTQLARKAAFAGDYPDHWFGYHNRITGDEQVLIAKNIGLMTDKEKEREIVFIDHADTEEGKRELRKLKPRRYNCLVFNISDDDIHTEKGDLREINDKIRNKIRRDVIDHIRRLTKPDDYILLLSDHGFIEHQRARSIRPSKIIEDTQIMYRYINDAEEANGISVPYSGKRNVGKVTCIIGRSWYSRSKRGRYARFSHGGVSLHELLVPGVVLEKIQQIDEMRIEFKVPAVLEAIEDQRIEVPVSVENHSQKRIYIVLCIEDKVVAKKEIGPGEEFKHKETLMARLDKKTIPISLRTSLSDGKPVTIKGSKRNIQIKVQKRKDKVEFSTGLDRLD